MVGQVKVSGTLEDPLPIYRQQKHLLEHVKLTTFARMPSGDERVDDDGIVTTTRGQVLADYEKRKVCFISLWFNLMLT